MPRSVQHLVVGAGMIGAAVADALARRGADVLVVDRGAPGHGCSLGNAGWVTPCFATPLPRPGVIGQALRWLPNPESPFHMGLAPTPSNVRWLAEFALASRWEPFRRGSEALVTMSKHSLDAYRELEAESGAATGLRNNGLLMLALTEQGLGTVLDDASMMAALGVSGRSLDAAGVREIEPAYHGGAVGGVYYPDEAHLEPLATVRAFLARAERHGATVAPDVEVHGIRTANGRVASVSTSLGEIVSENVVLAAGVVSRDLVEALSVRLPLLGGKGYSMMVPAPDPAPRVPAMIVERKVAVTPYGERIRLAGTLELVRRDESIAKRRLGSIARSAAEIMPGIDSGRATDIWSGLRPCTPDGLPVIGPVPSLPNLYLATGHQMLGIQTAPATGRLIADLLTGETPALDPRPFRVERF